MKRIIILIFTVLLISCDHSADEILNNQDRKVDVQERIEDWSNPALIMGSSFGNIVNTAFKVGDFDLLYNLTDYRSKKQYSKNF